MSHKGQAGKVSYLVSRARLRSQAAEHAKPRNSKTLQVQLASFFGHLCCYAVSLPIKKLSDCGYLGEWSPPQDRNEMLVFYTATKKLPRWTRRGLSPVAGMKLAAPRTTKSFCISQQYLIDTCSHSRRTTWCLSRISYLGRY